jgi:NAD(P)-dependent dehydrogenase (short-subunit alcohol dehydrogenase family)
MEILITGGFGNVGRSTVKACIAAGHRVTILERPQALTKADAGLPLAAGRILNIGGGWYADSDQAEELLHFRQKTLEDYYEEVRWETRLIAPFATLAAPAIRRWLIQKSPYLKGKIKSSARRVQGLLRLSKQEKR